ncbi:MAG: ribonucleoside-diphosphate reductase subunit alpha [Parachlamydiales bacterium]|nr:ribonucleoside-diphosphate reductase subunit alpha [Verrucomicrobiota bacterium]MBX3719001.1 ribonucleoside-diphosphate reductase subunit alpha [Candidatus Acheromyda pituitae]
MQRFAIVKRNGSIVPFRRDRIHRAVEAAFRDTKKVAKSDETPADMAVVIEEMTDLVINHLYTLASKGASLTVEGIQDQVEVVLMKAGHLDVARDYIIYRDQHKALREDSPQNLKMLREDGTLVRFNPMKVASSIEDAFRRTQQLDGPATPEMIEAVNIQTQKVVARAAAIAKSGQQLHAALIQDEIENQLMRDGYFHVAKDFIIHRASIGGTIQAPAAPAPMVDEKEMRQFTVVGNDGVTRTITEAQLRGRLKFACRGLEDVVSSEELLESSVANFYEGMKESEVDLANMMASRAKIEFEPAYSNVASRLLLDSLYRESMGITASDPNLESAHRDYFKKYLKHAISIHRIHPDLLSFDLDKLSRAMQLQRDDKFTYLGLQTLYDRYFIHEEQRRLETPQIFWMRVAMGLALSEKEKKNERAIEFYDTLSNFLFVSGTPTLFNSGTMHPQLSSCYLSTVMDDLHHIFKVVADDAQLSKWAGGIGNDWTNVRATGASIRGTNGRSQGVIPFLKVANDTAVAVNQGGKRKGAMCAYLETWHLDIEDFLELRKNTGDERRRTHDMNTANWIPDVFMKRVSSNGMWTLFSPSDVPDLHDLYGDAFEKRYNEYEKMADEGKIKLFKRIEALQLWRKMLSMLFETGHPWVTFKDPSNIRSPQDHTGVVHSSNLCTEILLNTSADETAVCNLGSINLPEHMTDKGIDEKKLAATIRTAVRMLDNVIDINFYPTAESRNANLRHRPIGMGLMGFQDALYMLNISYASHEAVAFSDTSMELISYYAILSSSELAKERGTYSTYKGSKWDRGLLPIDTIALLEKERGGHLDMDRSMSLDWTPVRESIKKYGMRNSNTMAIAPTATISNITGITQSIEPMYKHLFVKSNLSGEFTIPNTFLVQRLKALKLWDHEMLDDLKYFDGSITEIERIPDDVKQLFLTAFEIEPDWLIECGSRRQKWIDMGQSLNLYLAEPSGKKLHQMYLFAWTKGLKTTYYLRSLGATQIEKSTTDINKRGLQPRWMKNKSASSNVQLQREDEQKPVEAKKDKPIACSMEEGCESCQ